MHEEAGRQPLISMQGESLEEKTVCKRKEGSLTPDQQGSEKKRKKTLYANIMAESFVYSHQKKYFFPFLLFFFISL